MPKREMLPRGDSRAMSSMLDRPIRSLRRSSSPHPPTCPRCDLFQLCGGMSCAIGELAFTRPCCKGLGIRRCRGSWLLWWVNARASTCVGLKQPPPGDKKWFCPAAQHCSRAATTRSKRDVHIVVLASCADDGHGFLVVVCAHAQQSRVEDVVVGGIGEVTECTCAIVTAADTGSRFICTIVTIVFAKAWHAHQLGHSCSQQCKLHGAGCA